METGEGLQERSCAKPVSFVIQSPGSKPGWSFGAAKLECVDDGGMGAEKTFRHWVVGLKEVSRLQKGRRHGKPQAVTLPTIEKGQKPDPREFGEMGSKRNNFEGGLEMTIRQHIASSKWNSRSNEKRLILNENREQVRRLKGRPLESKVSFFFPCFSAFSF